MQTERPPDPDLSSPSNPRVKALVRLRDRGFRDERGQTVVEGHDELHLALAAGVRPLEVLWAPSLVRADQTGLLDTLDDLGSRITSVSRGVFEKISYRQSPDGWLAVTRTPGVPLADLALPADPLVLVGEGLEKPGNLGAMLRTAEALGVDAVISASPVTDLGNPNVVRASKGTVFAIPVATATSADVLAWLRDSGIRVVVTTPAGDVAVGDVDLTGPTALVIGAESTGVTDLWLDAADVRTVIPLCGHVNSLNASAAAAMVTYEAVRQRGRRP